MVPSARDKDSCAKYSFLHEEITALAERGVEAIVASTAPVDYRVGRVLVRAAPQDSWRQRLRVAAFVAQQSRKIPSQNLLMLRQLYRTARIECFASQLVLTHQVDLIHSCFAWPDGMGGLLASSATGRPLLASFRGTDITVDHSLGYGMRRRPSIDLNVRHLLKGATKTIFNSSYLRREATLLEPKAAGGAVIMKGVDTTHFRPADRAAAQLHLGLSGRPTLLAVCGLTKLKNVGMLLRVTRELPAVQLVICGEGPELGSLVAEARLLGVSSRVRFEGRISRDRIPAYFAACDVFVHAAKHEAAGNVLVEAMASARPVVCTDAGGPAEYVLDGRTGFVVPVDNIEQFVHAVQRLLASEECRRSFGDAGRDRSCELSFASMIDAILAQYSEICDEHGQEPT